LDEISLTFHDGTCLLVMKIYSAFSISKALLHLDILFLFFSFIERLIDGPEFPYT